MITCIHCKKEKEISEFYKHTQTRDGILHKCKECIREYQRNKDNSGIDRKREQKPERKAWKKEFIRQFRINNPEKWKAQCLVNNFFRKKGLSKPDTCVVTGQKGGIIHLHHFDYTKPNEVIPCTPKVHSDFHQGKIPNINPKWIMKLNF